MDIIAKVRELGAALQQDERYLRLVAAEQANDADTELNEQIAQLRMLQMTFQHESAQEQPDEEKLKVYDQEFSKRYAEIMQNPNMIAYSNARSEIDGLMRYINDLLALCLQGEDPATCEPAPAQQGCSGDCSGCAGCQ